MALPPPPSITIPSGTGKKAKKPARPPGPASGSYVAGRLLAGSGSAWRSVYSQIETDAKGKLGSSAWAPWVLAQLMSENPGGPPRDGRALAATINEVTQDIYDSKGRVPGGASSIIAGATGGSPPPLPPGISQAGGKLAKTAIYDGWATVRNGKLVGVDPTKPPPKDVVKWNGVPITIAYFTKYQNSINNVYIAYTGKNGTAAQIANILNHGINIPYTLTKQLASTAAFRNSPYWKAHVDEYVAAWQKIYGANSKPDFKAVQTAMANQVGSGQFSVELRQRPDYTKSEEFQSNNVQMQNEYQAIYGTPDQNGNELIKQATLAGWDPAQFAAYLRKQPGYTRSPEYQSKVISFLGALGMVTGGTPSLTGAAAQGTAPLTGGAPPPDQRVPYPGAAPEPVGPLGALTPGLTGGAPPPNTFGGP